MLRSFTKQFRSGGNTSWHQNTKCFLLTRIDAVTRKWLQNWGCVQSGYMPLNMTWVNTVEWYSIRAPWVISVSWVQTHMSGLGVLSSVLFYRPPATARVLTLTLRSNVISSRSASGWKDETFLSFLSDIQCHNNSNTTLLLSKVKSNPWVSELKETISVSGFVLLLKDQHKLMKYKWVMLCIWWLTPTVYHADYILFFRTVIWGVLCFGESPLAFKIDL